MIDLVYYTSKSGNTKRFLNNFKNHSIMITKDLCVNRPYILFSPTYAKSNGKCAVHKTIINFLKNEENRKFMKGVIGLGNKNFGKLYAIAGDIISLKCNVPLLGKVEFYGTKDDVKNISRILKDFS